jgi:hypothetical protein
MVLTTDAKFRKFEGTIRSNGMPVLTGVVPGRLYTDSGIVELPAGKEITWYSTIKDYSARIGTRRERKPGWNAALEFGGRLVEYKTPTEIGVKTHGIYPTKETNALFISDIRQYFAGFSFWFNYTGSSGCTGTGSCPPISAPIRRKIPTSRWGRATPILFHRWETPL